MEPPTGRFLTRKIRGQPSIPNNTDEYKHTPKAPKNAKHIPRNAERVRALHALTTQSPTAATAAFLTL